MSDILLWERLALLSMVHNWWVLALRGVAALIFGFLALLLPGMTLAILVVIFAAYLLADGVFAIVTGIRAAESHHRSWPLFVEGVIDIVAAAAALAWPGLTVLVFVTMLGIWAVVSGVFLIMAGFRLHGLIGEWLLILGGLLSVLLGLFFIALPGVAALAYVWVLGVYAILFGIVALAAGFRLRGHASV